VGQLGKKSESGSIDSPRGMNSQRSASVSVGEMAARAASRTNSFSNPQSPSLRGVTTTTPKRTSQSPTQEEKERAELLCSAAWNGSLEDFRIALAIPNVDKVINIPNSRGQTALYCAAHEGKIEIILDLLNTELVNLNGGNSDHGGTALHASSFADHPAIVAALLIAGGDPLVKNKKGVSGRSEARGATMDVYALWDTVSDELSYASVLSQLKSQYPELNQLTTPGSRSSSEIT